MVIKDEISRLIGQAVCWKQETETLFDQVRIQPGWCCADLGCGPIGVLGPLSHRVGSSGQILGFDLNLQFTQAARDFRKKNKLNNTNVINSHLFHLPTKPHSFNLTHARFVFTQIGCDQQLLESMIHQTKPGGVVVSQESDWTTWNCYPTNPYWNKVRDALICLFEYEGGDINAGQRLFSMYQQTILKNIQIRTTILSLPFGHPFRSGMIQMALSMREKLIAAHILTENEFNEAIEECQRTINNPESNIFSYMLCQVWGWLI